jgi:hypothetical protein
MYCSAMTTRLLVGILTPAMRATLVSPHAGRQAAAILGCFDRFRETQKAAPGTLSGLTGPAFPKNQNSGR